MNETLFALLSFLVFPGFLFTAVAGLFVAWIDRKLTARLQWRVGPPHFGFPDPLADESQPHHLFSGRYYCYSLPFRSSIPGHYNRRFSFEKSPCFLRSKQGDEIDAGR